MKPSNQQIVFNALYRRGFSEIKREESYITMVREIGYLRVEADIDPFGNVNGKPLKEFTRRLR